MVVAGQTLWLTLLGARGCIDTTSYTSYFRQCAAECVLPAGAGRQAAAGDTSQHNSKAK